MCRGLEQLQATSLSALADTLLQDPEDCASQTNPNLLVHRERVQDPSGEAPPREQACRVENFVCTSPGWAEVSALLNGVCAQLFGEEAVLFKDKVNYKLPGGGGFKPHQDVTAYKSEELATTHISVMVAIDPADCPELGPLEVALGEHTNGVVRNTHGVIDADVEAGMAFTPLMVAATDVVFFSSYLPHRSQPNTHPTRGRRLAYLTYNPASQGEHHGAYYAAKLAAFADGTAGSISINDDFSGTIVQ